MTTVTDVGGGGMRKGGVISIEDMLRRFIAVLVFLAAGVLSAHAQETSRGARPVAPSQGFTTEDLYDSSFALVIGINSYQNGWPRLSNAIRDAELVSAELGRRGFDVTLATDLDADGLEAAIEDFVYEKGRSPANRLLIWFAGHGHMIGDEAYLVPVDAPSADTDWLFRRQALSLRDFGKYMREIRSRHVLAVFDSCFSGSVFETVRALPSPAITGAVELPVRQLITSGQAEEEVSDNGVFRKLFLAALTGEEPRADANGDGYLTGSELGLFLSDRVTSLTGRRQSPRYGKLRELGFDRGDFVFDIGRRPPAPAQTEQAPTAALPLSDIQAQFEVARSIASSSGWSAFVETFRDDERARFFVSYAQEEIRRGGGIGRAVASLPPAAPAPPERAAGALSHELTIPAGSTVEQAYARIAAHEGLTGEMPFVLPPEGALVAGTVRFADGTRRADLVARMRDDQDALVKSVWERRAKNLPIENVDELLSLASIVEKEALNDEDRARIAAVFVNRLRNGMRLQSDPTLVYGLFGGKGKPAGRKIMRSDIEKKTPYNTYQIDGLPTGPIAIPGRYSLEAAANPAESTDLYFVSDGAGGHLFATTLEDHNENVARFRASARIRDDVSPTNNRESSPSNLVPSELRNSSNISVIAKILQNLPERNTDYNPEEEVAVLSPEPDATEEAGVDASDADSDAAPKFTRRLTTDGSEVDDGPANGVPAAGEGTSVAAATKAAEEPETTVPANETAVPIGQRAIFYEERTSVAEGSAEPGATVWSLIQESPGDGLPPEPAIRAEASVPGKDVQLRMTIRRNADKSLPASHIVELIFITPDSFAGGAIENVLRMTMKENEESAGSPLAGMTAKIADGFFLLALNNEKQARDANNALLSRQNWIDVPIVYKSGRRALMTMEKGIPGEQVFEQALRAWQEADSG